MNNTNQTMQHSRSPWIAGALSLIMPGLGQIYAGTFVRGLVWMCLSGAFCVIGLLVLAHPSAFSWTLGCAAELASVAIWIAGVIDSYRCALRCKADYERKDYNRWYVYVLLLLMGTGSLLSYAINVRDHLIQPFCIPSASMYPTISPGDHIVATKNAYWDADPQRGDLVLFPDPRNPHLFWTKRISRVIAIAGDTVAVKDGNVYVNGVELSRQSVGSGVVSGKTGQIFYEENNGAKYRIFISQDHSATDFTEITVPKYECFVMGDNRNESQDSRYFGPIPIIGIYGKFEYRYWPITRLGKIQ
ncbi:MAG: signal peptidase I [Limisphaerales bacterium]